MTYWINVTDGSVVTDGFDVIDGPDSTDGTDWADGTDGADGTAGIDGLMGQLRVKGLIRSDRADWTRQADGFRHLVDHFASFFEQACTISKQMHVDMSSITFIFVNKPT